MAYKVIILYQLYMPSYFLGTFIEYPFLMHSYIMFLHKVKKKAVRKRQPFFFIQKIVRFVFYSGFSYFRESNSVSLK